MWYKKDYRRIFMDMHLNDSKPEEYLSRLDIEEFVRTLKQANVNNVVVKAKSHVGLNYWPSQIGKMHEGLKRRNLDYVGEMIKQCKMNDISVIVYFSQTHDNYAYEKYPDWRMVNEKGETSREFNGRYGLVCPNNKEYRKYCKEILQELTRTYEFEGMFLDMPFWPHICYCPACRERFWKETGHYIPRKVDWDDPIWVTFARSRQEWMNEYALENTRAVKAVKENISIEHNFAAVGAPWMLGDTEGMLKACDYAGGDYYGGYLQQSFMCKYYNNVTPNKPFSYITSRCDPNLYAHTVSRCKEDLLIHTMNALVHNGAFSICDAMNPDGTITREVYEEAIGPVYNYSSQFEQYVSGEMLADLSIWYNTNLKANENYIDSPIALAKIMQENNILYDVVGSSNIKEIKTPVLAINDIYEITDEEMEGIEAYVVGGGKLFITGRLAHPRLQELLEIEDVKESEYGYSYLVPTGEGKTFFETFNKQTPYPIEHTAIECTLRGEGDILATLAYPYTKPKSRDFSAIHSNPPGIHTTLPGVIKKNVGKGKILWVVTPLELTKAHYCRQTVCKLVHSLIPKRKIESNAPAYVEVTSWVKGDKTYIGVVNQQEVYPVYPVKDLVIKLNEKYRSVKLKTGLEEVLEVTDEGEKTCICLPELEVFHLIELSNE